jgi:hypothetical protein
VIDEIIDMHDRFMGTLFSKAKRKHDDRFQKDGKSIVRPAPLWGH